jgi:cysteine desulfurase/selenocysteine lyase
MIKSINWNTFELGSNPSPAKWEAGSPDAAAIISLGAALDYLKKIGHNTILNHELKLRKSAREMLGQFPEIKIYGPADEKNAAGILSFKIEGIHDHDLASVLAENQICLRAGQMCAQPLLNRLQINSLSRISFQIYNQESDLLKLEKAIQSAITLFKK